MFLQSHPRRWPPPAPQRGGVRQSLRLRLSFHLRRALANCWRSNKSAKKIVGKGETGLVELKLIVVDSRQLASQE
eukprot:4381709-Alexandrium_andersonii.AAC.1